MLKNLLFFSPLFEFNFHGEGFPFQGLLPSVWPLTFSLLFLSALHSDPLFFVPLFRHPPGLFRSHFCVHRLASTVEPPIGADLN